MNRPYLKPIISVSLLFPAFNAHTSVIYEQLPPGGGAIAITKLISSTLNNFGQTPGVRLADDFILSTGETITGLHWWGESNSGGDDFEITFYADGGGVPGPILHTSGGTLSVAIADGIPTRSPLSVYSSVLDSPFIAHAATTYWVSIYNQAIDASWLWLAAGALGNGSRRQIAGPQWDSIVLPDMAFQLSVPEPASLYFVGAGLAAFALRRGISRHLLALSLSCGDRSWQ